MFPITHGLIGWSVSQNLKVRKDRIAVTIASVIPDLDGLGAIISTDYYGMFHHVFGHNLFFGVLLSLIAFRFSYEKHKTAILVFLSFHTHILGDLLGSGAGWGIPYFWPISSRVYEFSPPFQWELDSWQNLLVIFICIVFVIICGVKKDRTVVEVFSKSVEKKLLMFLKSGSLK